MEPDDELVTLEQFPFLEQLEVVRALLESAGIECFCPDEQMSRFYSNGVRPRIQVRSSQFDEARAILDSFENAGDDSAPVH